MSKVYIKTIGCLSLAQEGSLYKDYFIDNGWEVTKSPRGADIVLLNLCGLGENLSLQNLSYIKKINKIRSKNTKIIVAGCIAEIKQKEVQELGVNAQFSPKDIGKLDEIMQGEKKICNIDQQILIPKNPLLSTFFKNNFLIIVRHFFESPSSIYDILYDIFIYFEHVTDKVWGITISKGCLNKCSYCVVRFARGKLKSLPSEYIINNVRHFFQQGHMKLMILGTNPCQYGLDREKEISYIELIENIIEIPYKFKLCLSDIYPNYFTSNFSPMLKAIKSGKIEEITFTLQSGSEEILKAMGRKYDIEKFKEVFREIKKTNHDIKTACHIIVGFPGETLVEFNKTFDMLKELDFDKVYLFPYLDMEKAVSSKLSKKIPENEIRKRINIMHRYLLFKKIYHMHFL
jgi:threonylcarbamoyladenosine tRNA methylthiotransferase MtaB